MYISSSLRGGQWDSCQIEAYALTCEDVSNAKLPSAISVCLRREGVVCSQAKEGLKPESIREGEHRGMYRRQPRALEQPWAEGQCGGAHGKEGPESNAIWRGGDREDSFLV